MNNQETVTISRESYDGFKKLSEELNCIKKNKISIDKDVIFHTYPDGYNEFIRAEYNIISITQSDKDKLFKEELERIRNAYKQQNSDYKEELFQYHLRYGELKEEPKPSFKKLFLGLYYKG